MEPENNGFSWTWKPGDQQHPYTYSWFNILNENIEEVNQRQQELEWELAYLDLLDALVDQMTSFPEIEELLKDF